MASQVRERQCQRDGIGSGGDWAYYEAKDFDRMEREIFDALLNGDAGDNRPQGRTNSLSRIFRRHRAPDLDDDGSKWRRYEVREVAYLDGSEWVPVKVTWSPPQVHFGFSMDIKLGDADDLGY